MPDQFDKAKSFHALHIPGRPLILYNVWDVGSAEAVATAGAGALATGSASVAAAHGFADGEEIPLGLALANAARIAASTDLPVSLDLERGYGEDAAGVGTVIAAALETGIVGCNIEDSTSEGSLRGIAEQAERIAAARAAAERTGIPLFINARTDVFFQAPADRHDFAMVEAALERAHAYAEAGASGLFVPLLADEALIGRLVEASPLPVNIMLLGPAPSVRRLAALGVARVSFGPGPYRLAMRAVEEAARELLRDSD